MERPEVTLILFPYYFLSLFCRYKYSFIISYLLVLVFLCFFVRPQRKVERKEKINKNVSKLLLPLPQDKKKVIHQYECQMEIQILHLSFSLLQHIIVQGVKMRQTQQIQRGLLEARQKGTKILRKMDRLKFSSMLEVNLMGNMQQVFLPSLESQQETLFQ